MSDWLENVEECTVDGAILLKISFEISSNFSFIEDIALKSLREKKIFEFDGNYDTKITSEFNNLVLDKDLEILNINLDEHPKHPGFFEVDIICKHILPKEFKDKKEYNDSARLSPIAKRIFDYFRIFSTLLDRTLTLIPSTLNLRIKSGEIWKRVAQIGDSTATPLPCEPATYEKFMETIPDLYKKIKTSPDPSKAQKILDIYGAGLRFKHGKFNDDAFFNFYKVIEMTFKNKKMFSSKHVNLFNKPSAYADAMCQTSQKCQMLFIWEYLRKINEKTSEELLEKMIAISELRNHLAHGGGEATPQELKLAHILARFMLHNFALGAEEIRSSSL